MAYFGNTPETQSFISGTDYFNGTGSQTTFTLTRTVNSVNDIEVLVNNVVQQPNSAYTINGTTITFTGAPSAGTQNIYVRYLSTTTQVIAPSQGSVGWNQLTADVQQDLGSSFKNRIINGACVIDQRNAGASVTPIASIYTLDRWHAITNVASKFSVQQNAGSVTPPVGFANYLGATSLSAYTVLAGDYFLIRQGIEGFNTSDLNWGTANAKTVTLSFQVYSSLTGTFGGSLTNSGNSRSYPFSYSIPVANTWTTVSVTIAGDTTGTWLTTNGIGINLWLGLGVGSTNSGTAGAWAGAQYYSATGATSVVGTNGATFYITGVQLEVGSSATGYEYRQYGTELALCQRYFEKSYNIDVVPGSVTNVGQSYYNITSDDGNSAATGFRFVVAKRAAPTMTGYSYTGTLGSWQYNRNGASGSATVNFFLTGASGTSLYMNVGAAWIPAFIQGQWTASAEL